MENKRRLLPGERTDTSPNQSTLAHPPGYPHEDLVLVSEGLMRIPDVGQFLGLSRSAIYELMRAGVLPWVKLGRSRRIPRRAVLEYAASGLHGADARCGACGR